MSKSFSAAADREKFTRRVSTANRSRSSGTTRHRQQRNNKKHSKHSCAWARPAIAFFWPTELASATSTSGFGYVMPLRDRRFRSIVDLMKRRIEPSFRALATAGLELSHSYLQLHTKGLCYRDISFGNAFFDPDTRRDPDLR